MIFSLSIANVSTVEAAEEPNNWIKMRFYSDAELQNEITSLENVGDSFYAKITLKNFQAINCVHLVLDYDQSKVQLANFSTGAQVSYNGSVRALEGEAALVNLDGRYGVLANTTIDLYNRQKMRMRNFIPTENDNYPYVDTTNGVLNFQAILP